MRFGVRSFLLIVAAALFIVAAALDPDDALDWLPIGLAVLAAAFVFEDVEMPGRK